MSKKLEEVSKGKDTVGEFCRGGGILLMLCKFRKYVRMLDILKGKSIQKQVE